MGLRDKFRRKPKQYTFCYCPNCGRELCSQPDAFMYDEPGDDAGGNDVAYRCACGTESHWNFDLFPCPVLWDALR